MTNSQGALLTSIRSSFLSFAIFLSSPLFLSAQSTEHFFTSPDAPFITGPKEEIHRVSLPAGTADAAQTLIDAARKEKDRKSVV